MFYKTFHGWEESGLDIYNYLIKGDFVEETIVAYLTDGKQPTVSKDCYLMILVDQRECVFMMFQKSKGHWIYNGLINQARKMLKVAA